MNRLLILVPCVALLMACSSDGEERRAEYLEADYFKRLELPPDIIYEENNNINTQLELPEPSEKAQQSFQAGLAETGLDVHVSKDNVDLSQQVVPRFDGLRLKSENGLYWLEIDKDADDLWPVLTSFWENEGVALSSSKPMLGIMETDWVSKYQINENDNFFSRFVSSLDKDQLDQFRMRVNKTEIPAQSKVYVTHSGLYNIADDEGSHFEPRASERELEVEILSRLLVYLGLAQQDATDLLAHYQPYANRVRLSAEDDFSLVMTGSEKFVWIKTLQSLSRLGLDVVEKNEQPRELKVVVQQLTSENLGGEKDEIADSSFIMQWFSGSGVDATKDASRQFYIQFVPSEKSVTIHVRDTNREPTESVLAEQLVKSLLHELN